MGITAIRVIRHRGSHFGVLEGGTRYFESIGDLMSFTRKHRKVFAFIDNSNGKQGICRSGRQMRRTDLIVKNVGSSFDECHYATPTGVTTVYLPSPAAFGPSR